MLAGWPWQCRRRVLGGFAGHSRCSCQGLAGHLPGTRQALVSQQADERQAGRQLDGSKRRGRVDSAHPPPPWRRLDDHGMYISTCVDYCVEGRYLFGLVVYVHTVQARGAVGSSAGGTDSAAVTALRIIVR